MFAKAWWDSADDPGLGRKRDIREDPLLRRHRGHPFGHPDTEIDYPAGRKLEGATARDDLALVELHRRDAVEWNALAS